ncbi:hypothetical protein RIU76_06675 [Latilactobacillus sakei subsp. sakei]|uniref:hypothetical protein n=1 Tax=Latilactobacillus sakei TaxID=1599 RepID=UPI00285CEDBC|nr:hypothetical protein [Latilactobacillus sakei]MDR7924408.1 hypothetical protein [Latilactobacillus sakei subsp. sakei]
MDDYRVEKLADDIRAGMKITTNMVRRFYRIPDQEAIDLLKKSKLRAEELDYDREVQEQNEIAARRRAKRYFNY